MLLTLSVVARRIREFGTLKAMGWRTRRIVGQVVSESVVIGVLGGALDVAVGYGGAALISAIAPTLSASVPSSAVSSGTGPLTVSGNSASGGGSPVQQSVAQATTHTVAVHFGAHVATDVIYVALLLGIAGGLLADGFGGWRAARLRLAAALSRVA